MSSPLPIKDLVATTLVLLSAAIELAVRESYYRLSAEVPRLFFVSGIWLLVVLAVSVAARRLSPGTAIAVGRVALFVGVGTWLDVVGTNAITSVIGDSGATRLILRVAYCGLLAGAWFAMRIPVARWSALRRATSVLCFLFVVSQPIVSSLRAPTVWWPDASAALAPATAGAANGTTIFLLLDELNAKSGGPIIEALSRAGREVHVKALVPAGDATGKVVPGMFTGIAFDDAKPCGVNTVCSGGQVLDFSKIVASRPDVDVVGFYEPYCAIRGLRSCAREAPESPVLDVARWWCAALRRSTTLTSIAGPAQQVRCAELNGEVWEGLIARVEESLWRAPVWQTGGFLFAHVPLPHPPGLPGGGSLTDHYDASLLRAARMVDRMVSTLRQRPDQELTIVVFSDHPLRSRLWCESTQYASNGCPLEERLVDDRVPLIVAGTVPPAFESVQSNLDIFKLVTPSPRIPTTGARR
jgi:hypothetical protein